MTGELVRTPVRITATSRPSLYGRLVGHEGTAYSGDPERIAVKLLSPLVRLSEEARKLSCAGYVYAHDVTVEEIATPTETVML